MYTSIHILIYIYIDVYMTIYTLWATQPNIVANGEDRHVALTMQSVVNTWWRACCTSFRTTLL